ncbi:MAG: Asp/Glu/hydantoin racemase [Gammaproteobacteria bacterium]|jgi:Asp/Glu/hydantoin racemase
MVSAARSTAPRIALVHAVAEAIAPINAAFAADWPEAQTFNLMDDSLSRDRAARGAIDDAMTARFVALSRYCVSTGADAVQFTCSAFNPCIDAAQSVIDIPVLQPDAAMIETAFTHGPRLGAIVTCGPAVDSITAQVNAFAAMMGVHPQLDVRLAEGALEAFRAGDVDEHDRRIAEAAAQLGPCDVVMLGQYSMARAAPLVRTPGNVPLLSSPAAAVRELRELLTPEQRSQE